MERHDADSDGAGSELRRYMKGGYRIGLRRARSSPSWCGATLFAGRTVISEGSGGARHARRTISVYAYGQTEKENATAMYV
jgi:hypothetical protein